jgi:hypothetical protein
MHSPHRFTPAFVVAALLTCQSLLAQEAPPASQPAPGSQPTTGPAGKLEMSPQDFRFGDTWQGFPAEREFTVKNVGAGPLEISVTSSCGCTVASKPKSPLPPGESSTFKVTYNTTNLGPTDKHVTVTTNDPDRITFDIPVQGTVKPLYEIKPGDYIIFEELDRDTHATGSVRVESKYTGPMHAKLLANYNSEWGPFDVQLTPIQPGREFEVSATTRPPLPVGRSMGTVQIDTGLPNVLPITVRISGYVPPRVAAQPDRLAVTQQFTRPMQHTVRLVYRESEPVEVTDVKCDLPDVHWEIQPPSPPPEGSHMAYREIRLTVPGFADLPAKGGKLDIYTDAGGEFAKLTVQIERRLPHVRRPPRPPAPPAAQPPTPTP